MLRFIILFAALGASSVSGAEYTSDNFVTTHATPALAAKLGKKAEAIRAELGKFWFPDDKLEWLRRCRIAVVESKDARDVAFELDMRNTQMKITLRADTDEEIDSPLREGVCRALFAGYYPVVLPFWIEEGTALYARNANDRRAFDEDLWKLSRERKLRLAKDLFEIEADTTTNDRYTPAECYSLVKYLLHRRKRGTFVTYVEEVARNNRISAMHSLYGFSGDYTFDTAWSRWLEDEAQSARN